MNLMIQSLREINLLMSLIAVSVRAWSERRSSFTSDRRVLFHQACAQLPVPRTRNCACVSTHSLTRVRRPEDVVS